MKKLFTLIAMAAIAMGANAEQYRPTADAPEAGSTIISDRLLNVSTVFETTNKKAEVGDEEKVPVSYTIGGETYTFEYYTQIRVDAAPSASVPEGTDKGGSTSWIIEAYQDVDITVFYRRQQVSGSCDDNDGKDLKLVDQTKATTAIQSASFEWVPIEEGNTDYAYAVKTYNLEAGKKYTLWARGTTIQCYGMDYTSGSGVEPVVVEDGVYIISFDGQSAANKLEYNNGFTLQITGNETKSIGNGASVTVGDKTYTSMKVSNGAENTLTLPEGKYANGITFYSYVNVDEATERDSYWKEVAGVAYDAEASGGLFQSFKDGANPDKRTYTFDQSLTAITFTNTGEQCCYVIEIEITSEPTGIQAVKTVSLNEAAYSLSGQKVGAGYKGLVVKAGKKFVQK